MPRRPAAPPDLHTLLDSWEISLRAERKSDQTVKSYGDGVRRYLTWCHTSGHPAALDRRQLTAWIADLLDAGAQPATAAARQLAVRRFSAWLTDEGEQDTDPLLGVKAPKLDTKVVEPLTDEQITALIRACRGKEFRDIRDEAIVRLMVETGVRAGELCALAVADINLHDGLAVV
ncbi:tyrosine-type recombinase/integrase, partial [Mycobacterium sp.]|uniref:tyrosine-type recombinase/integrase n=1 Tax=Mycobacterium sp. TaxID=1785 RepID=UPI001278B494